LNRNSLPTSGDFDAIPTNLPVSADNIRAMKKEFDFWYPMDLRVSGKDLIGNHLIMALYNHAAVYVDSLLRSVCRWAGLTLVVASCRWSHKPQLWPRSFYTNGHVQVNGGKMSKSNGTFLTLIDGAGLCSRCPRSSPKHCFDISAVLYHSQVFRGLLPHGFG